MGIFNGNMPYSNLHSLNLDWIAEKIKEISEKTDDIDENVTLAVDSANNAQTSEENARASEENVESIYENISNTIEQVNENTEDITLQTQRLDNLISSSTPDANAELIDIRVGANGVTYDTAGNAVRGQYDTLKTADGYYHDFPAPAWLFYASKSYNFNTNAYGNTATQATSIPILLEHPFIVKSYDANTSIRTKFGDTLINWNKETLVPANTQVILNFGFAENCTREQFDNVHFIMSEECYKNFIEKYTINLNERGSTYISETNKYFTRNYSINTDGDNIGLLSYGSKQVATSVYPFYGNNVIIYRYTGNSYNMVAFLNETNAVVPINNAGNYNINADTLTTITGSYYTDSGNMLIPIIEDTEPEYIIRLHARLNIDTRCDIAFEDSLGHTWCFGRTGPDFYVFENQTLIAEGEFTYPFGHGNTCNYVDNKLYVTDGEENNYGIIHVYSIDETNYTVNYLYDISVPVDSNMLGGNYYVDDNENIIYAINYTSTNLVYRLLYKQNATYFESCRKLLPLPTRYMQGMTYKNKCLYYLDNDSSYQHVAIKKFDMETGVVKSLNIASSASTIDTAETEAIFPVIGDNTFKIIAVNGLCFIVSKY